MFCAISNTTPEVPVVSSKSGHLFEKSLIEKALESSGGRCPVTGELLAASDLLPLKVGASVKPRPAAATSIPGMLSLFQNEWDALMLELYSTKQAHDSARQELGHALYQHDAACRVIARLIKERDDARRALTEAQHATPAPAAAPAAAGGGAVAGAAAGELSAAVVAKFDATNKELSKGRKKRPPPPGQASAEQVAAYSKLASSALHGKGSVCVDSHRSEPLVATGGADGVVCLYDTAQRKALSKMKGHDGAVHRERTETAKMALHAAAVTDVSIHPTGDYAVSASADGSWKVADLSSGGCVLSVEDAASLGSGGFSCSEIHPDGLILGTGTGTSAKVWDIKSRANVASFDVEQPVSCLSFSENGFYLATGGAEGALKLWDLRKLKNIHTIDVGAPVRSAAFDFSGQFLAAAAGTTSLYETKSWASLAQHKAAASGVSFGAAASLLAAAGPDGKLTLYGSA